MSFPGMTRRQVSRSSAMNAVPIAWPYLIAADDDLFLNATDGVFAATTAAGVFAAEADMTKTRAPDYGRNVTVKVTDNADADLDVDVRIHGKDQFGKAIFEDFLTLTGAGGAQAGSKMFSRVTSVEILSFTGTGTASDNLIVGAGKNLAIPEVVSRLGAVMTLCSDGVPVDVDAGTIDTTYSAILCDSANGAGSNSGQLAAGDIITILLALDPSEDDDDHFDVNA